MRQVIKHRDIRLLNMIRRTDPVIPYMVAGSCGQECSISPVGGRGYADANGSRRKIRTENLYISYFCPIFAGQK